jgi:hypothetical protein
MEVSISRERLLQVVETGTLAMGSAGVAFPRLSARLGGADPNLPGITPSARALGFWLTAYGALLQYVETEEERDRLLLAGAALGSAYCVNTLAAAARKQITWRGALTHLVMVGTMAGAACAYLAD